MRPRLAWWAALGLCACFRTEGPAMGPGSETVGLTGEAVYPDGMPARFASVTARPEEYLMGLRADGPRKPGRTARTDSAGRYRLDSLPPGTYAIEIRDEDHQAALVRQTIRPDVRHTRAPKAVLKHVGGLRGRIRNPGTGTVVLVQVYGLDRHAFADPSGEFLLPDLPPGGHRLKLSALLPVQGALDVPGVEIRPRSIQDLGPLSLSASGEDYSQWPHSRRIHIRTGAAGARVAGAVTDFPLPVRLHAGNFPFDSTVSPSGADIRFASASGRHLPYEIESWDAAARRATVWVRVDTVLGNNDSQFIVLHWGKAGAPDLSVGRAVFDTALGYRAVWHLGEDPRQSPQFRDATALGQHAATPLPLALDTNTSPLFQGIHVDGRRGVLSTQRPAPGPQTFTISFWFQAFSEGKLAGFEENANGAGSTRTDRHFWIGAAGSLHFGVLDTGLSQAPDAGRRKVSSAPGYPGYYDWNWHHVAGTLSPATGLTLYANGALVARDTAVTRADDFSGHWVLGYGNIAGWTPVPRQLYVHGALDEVRVEGTARTADWIQLSYETQRMNSTVLLFAP